MDNDLIDITKAELEFETATLKMKVLTTLTKEKNVIQYEADIAKAKAKKESDEISLALEEGRQEHLQTQLANCKILAPQDGQVIYYMTRWGGEEDLIKEGKKVYERQILLRLPDISQMQVKGLVNEANIRLLKVGQTATIRLEAFPNRVFSGIVRDVNDYPEPSHWMGGSMSKEYMTTILMLDPPQGIKPGLTAEAKITVDEINNALILPVQAVFEHGGKTYAISYNEGQWAKIEVKTGPTNDREVVILEGLEAGDSVVLGAWTHRDKVDLPKLTKEEEAAQKAKEQDNMEQSKPEETAPVAANDAMAELVTSDEGKPETDNAEEEKSVTEKLKGAQLADAMPLETEPVDAVP